MGPIRRLQARARYEARSIVGRWPTPYFALAPMSERIRDYMVRRDSDIVIEGFPRSGNTFAVVAFAMAQPDPVLIAHHLHVPAQVIRGLQLGIPTLVIVRDPVEAVASELVRRHVLSTRQVLRQYVRFHRAVLRHRSRIVVADFEEVTDAFDTVIDRVNAKFTRSFEVFRHTPENVARCFTIIEDNERSDRDNRARVVRETHVARPSEAREELKAARRRAIEAPRLSRLLGEANSLRSALLAAD